MVFIPSTSSRITSRVNSRLWRGAMWRVCHLRADSVVWLSHMSSVWPWSGMPKVLLYGTFLGGLRHDPICYAPNPEVAFLTSSERSHVLYEIIRTGWSLNWIFPWFQYVWSNISVWIPMGISCGIQDIKPRLRWWPLRVEWHVYLRVDSAVWLSHTSSIWSWLGVPRSTFVWYICKPLTSLTPTNEESAWAQWGKKLIEKNSLSFECLWCDTCG